MKKLAKLMKGYGRECVLAPLFKMLEASFELLVPLVVAQIVDKAIPTGDVGYLGKMCILLVALGAVGLISSATAQFFAARAAVGYSARLRHTLLQHLLGLSYTQLDNLGVSTMVTRMTADINQVQNGVNLGLRLLLRSPFVVFGAAIMAFTIDAQAAWVFIGLIFVLCLVVFGIMLLTLPMYKRVQQGVDKITSDVRQNLSGVRVLRAFHKEDREEQSFREDTQQLRQRQLFAGRISALLNPLTFVLVNLGIILLIYTGAVKVQHGLLTQGLVIALYNYMSQILVELVKMANLIITITKAYASGKRIAEVLAMESAEQQGTCRETIRGAVEFVDVTARYAGSAEPSLEHISFRAEPGQTVGIIGGTGSGKTTLVELIPGFYPPAAGQVRIDGIPVAEYAPEILRSSIGTVPQKAVLFQGTVRENLRWRDPDASDADLWKALEIAQAREVVKDKEGELDAPVQVGGSNFSGGQRQRLTLARALVGKPAILILDDSASALDYATEAALRQALRSLEPAPTTFIVSQRAASVRHADSILVLDDGVLVGKGTHEQLLESCTVYQEIYYSQFPKEVTGHG